jgi:hypothetical protein
MLCYDKRYALSVKTVSSITVVHRRYSDFYELDHKIRYFCKTENMPTLPQKKLKIFTNHLKGKFVSDRKNQLEAYLSSVLNQPFVSNLSFVRSFLGFPINQRVCISYFQSN